MGAAAGVGLSVVELVGGLGVSDDKSPGPLLASDTGDRGVSAGPSTAAGPELSESNGSPSPLSWLVAAIATLGAVAEGPAVPCA
jgi:hypothetical protein